MNKFILVLTQPKIVVVKRERGELGLEQATLVLTQPKIVVVKRGRGSLDLSQTSFNQLFTDITAFFVQNFVMDKNYV